MENNDDVLARSETPEMSDRPLAAAADAGRAIACAESGHTPGPWSFVRRAHKSECCGATMAHIGYVKADSGHTEVAVLYSDDEQEANGCLIAAAPDLLAAALEAWEELAQCRQNDDVDRVMNQLHAAITKANGAK